MSEFTGKDDGSTPMAADDILLDTEDRMDKAIQHLKTSLAGIRTGRTNPGLVDSQKVQVYGSTHPRVFAASSAIGPSVIRRSPVTVRPPSRLRLVTTTPHPADAGSKGSSCWESAALSSTTSTRRSASTER